MNYSGVPLLMDTWLLRYFKFKNFSIFTLKLSKHLTKVSRVQKRKLMFHELQGNADNYLTALINIEPQKQTDFINLKKPLLNWILILSCT